MPLEIIPVKIDKEIEQNDDISELILSSTSKPEIKDNDILIVTQKIISKQEGRTVQLSTITPSLVAMGIGSEYGKDPQVVQKILDESKRIVRLSDGIIISETIHGFVCANAGVDESNIKHGYVTLLPKDANMSAQKLRESIKKKTGKNVAVIISDTFGRPFRMGQTNCAIGLAGISAIADYVGTKDTFGRVLHVTEIAIVDEICSASELVMGKSLNTPITIVRNYKFSDSKSDMNDLLRPKDEDLFR
ncbi:MAG TPA: coenzyme F420-0:L-glutamate ligase [Nitrosopumilaceae archaeon]|nr:coenzyme F420-0:L-glutamate ligase [Nitrosopumilaceae archaeon]